jgi:tetratricopeptide (TPR) repeat protein
MKARQIATITVGLLMIAIITWNLAAKFLGNLGALGLLSLTCIPEKTRCDPKFSSYLARDQDILSSRYRDLFLYALQLAPDETRIQLHLAEIAFALGERTSAAAWMTDLKHELLERSWLSYRDRYPAFLIAGYREHLAGRWQQAINNFKLGLFWAGDAALNSDEEIYVRSLVNHYLAPEDIHASDRLRAGMYALAAGEPLLAKDILTALLGQPQSPDATVEIFAKAHRTLGLIAEKDIETQKAQDYFRTAMELDPDYRLVQYDLLRSLTETGDVVEANDLKAELNHLGPSFRLGLFGEGFEEERPARLSDGWNLVGYDVESELIPDSHQLELVLWWKKTGNRPLSEGMLDTGDYVLQKQTVINLLPNPGMEWGVDEKGIPLGYAREFYTGDPTNLVISNMVREEKQSRALIARNTSDIRSLALASRIIPVYPEDYMLMSGWIYREQGHPNLGRNCWGWEFIPGGPYYIAYTQSQQQSSGWFHAADLAKPVPGSRPDACEVLLINYESDQPAAWDDLIWVKIQIP